MIDTGAGVIDADYRGTVHVLLFNLSDKDFEVDEGDRVAQLILERIVTPEVTEVEVSPGATLQCRIPLLMADPLTEIGAVAFSQSLSETARGAGGFGSTGGFKVIGELDGGKPATA